MPAAGVRARCRSRSSFISDSEWLALLARQTNSGAFELLSNFGNFGRIGLGLGTLLPLLQRQLPLRDRFFDLTLLEVDVSEVVVDRGIAVDLLDRLTKVLLRLVESVEAEVHPAEAVEICPVVRLEIQGFANHFARFFQALTAV